MLSFLHSFIPSFLHSFLHSFIHSSRARNRQLHFGALNVRQRFADAYNSTKSKEEEAAALARAKKGGGEKFSKSSVNLRRATALGDLRYYSEERQYSLQHIAACRAKAEKIGRVEVASAILVVLRTFHLTNM